MSALTAAGSTRLWRNTRPAVLERDGYRCHWCGQAANTVDHLIPRARGGTDDPANLVAACGTCNSRRGAEETNEPTAAEPSREW